MQRVISSAAMILALGLVWNELPAVRAQDDSASVVKALAEALKDKDAAVRRSERRGALNS